VNLFVDPVCRISFSSQASRILKFRLLEFEQITIRRRLLRFLQLERTYCSSFEREVRTSKRIESNLVGSCRASETPNRLNGGWYHSLSYRAVHFDLGTIVDAVVAFPACSAVIVLDPSSKFGLFRALLSPLSFLLSFILMVCASEPLALPTTRSRAKSADRCERMAFWSIDRRVPGEGARSIELRRHYTYLLH